MGRRKGVSDGKGHSTPWVASEGSGGGSPWGSQGANEGAGTGNIESPLLRAPSEGRFRQPLSYHEPDDSHDEYGTSDAQSA